MSTPIITNPGNTDHKIISPILIDSIIEGITGPGYAITLDFLPESLIQQMADEALALQRQGLMRRGATGTDRSTSSANPRGDFIYWLEEQQANPIQQAYFSGMAQLRNSLNRALYMGLFDLEAHYAIYPTGAVYHKHLDQFRGKEERQVSCILYLNQDWQESDGGKLRLYLNGTASTPYIDVTPRAGTLVTFLSGRFLHEVLPAQRPRISLTGWLRKRPLSAL